MCLAATSSAFQPFPCHAQIENDIYKAKPRETAALLLAQLHLELGKLMSPHICNTLKHRG